MVVALDNILRHVDFGTLKSFIKNYIITTNNRFSLENADFDIKYIEYSNYEATVVVNNHTLTFKVDLYEDYLGIIYANMYKIKELHQERQLKLDNLNKVHELSKRAIDDFNWHCIDKMLDEKTQEMLSDMCKNDR